MALSGNFSKYPVTNLGLYCTWSATQSATGNYSDVTVKVYLKYKALTVGARSDATVSINGTSETYSTAAISESSTSDHSKLLKTKTVRVNHNTDGTKTGVSLSASWRFDGTYSGTPIGTITASTTVSLDAIDRTAPTVTVSASEVTSSGLKLTAKSSAKADIWQYSKDNGSTYTQFSTTAGTSASVTLSSLTPNTTYNLKVRARKASNQVYGTSSKLSVLTIGGATLNSVTAFNADSSGAQIKMNVSVYDASYKHRLTVYKGSTATLTIDNLTWTKGTADRTITLTDSQRNTLLNAFKTSKYYDFKFTLTTLNSSSVQIGNDSTVTARVSTTQANSAPTFSDFNCYDVNQTVVNVTGDYHVFVQGLSSVTFNPGTAIGKNGATISSYTYTFGNLSESIPDSDPINLGVITKSGSAVQASVTVTDSRGWTTTVKKTYKVIAYEKPKISSITLRRTDGIEAEIQLILSGTISSVKPSSTEKNSLSYIRYRSKLTSATSYGSYVNILSGTTRSGTSFSYSNLQLCSLSQTSSYNFQITLQDVFGESSSITYTYTIPQGIPLVSLRKEKVGINIAEPNETLDVNGNAKASQFVRPGKATQWRTGRDYALLRTTSATDSTYNPLFSAKSYTGSWDLGPYSSSTLHLVHISDSNYSSGTNLYDTQYSFTTDGTFKCTKLQPTDAVAVANGGTGATTASAARTNLGLGNIGTVYKNTEDITSAAGGSWVNGASVTLPAGSYIITGNATFANNAGVKESVSILCGSTRYNTNTVPVPNAQMTVSTTTVIRLSSETVCYISIMHHASSAFKVSDTTIRAMRII